MSRLAAAAIRWWDRVRRRNKISCIRYVTSMDDVPRDVGATLFIVENSGVTKWAVLECPLPVWQQDRHKPHATISATLDAQLVLASTPLYGSRANVETAISSSPAIELNRLKAAKRPVHGG